MKCRTCETMVQDGQNGTFYEVAKYSASGDETGSETRCLCWKCLATMERGSESIDGQHTVAPVRRRSK